MEESNSIQELGGSLDVVTAKQLGFRHLWRPKLVAAAYVSLATIIVGLMILPIALIEG